MQLYSAKVRIGGSLEHEVVKHNLTAAEIHLLNSIHAGKHPVCVDIVHTANVNRTDSKERARLAEEYSKGELVEDRGKKMINGLFGVTGVPLPQEYVAPVIEQVEYLDPDHDDDEVVEPVAPINRASVPKPVKKDRATGVEGLLD